jgi:predicted MFS family arabinose efflux permease
VVTGFVALFFLVLMPLFGWFQIVALLFVVRSILWAISWTVLQSFTMGVTAESRRSTTYGIVFAAWGVASSVGNFIGSEFLSVGLLYLPFATSCVAYLGYSVALLVFFRRTRPPEEVSRVRIS